MGIMGFAFLAKTAGDQSPVPIENSRPGIMESGTRGETAPLLDYVDEDIKKTVLEEGWRSGPIPQETRLPATQAMN